MGKQIRPVTLLDLLSLSIPPAAALHLDLAQQMISPRQFLRGLLSSWLHLRGPSHTLLCWGDEGLLACVQAWPWSRNSACEVRYLAVWKAARTQEDVLWEELLAALALGASQEGVTRLLARLPDEGYLELFQRAGFSPFAEERVLVWDGTEVQDVRPTAGLQPVGSEHLWAINQLHANLIPPIVQRAEGYVSDSWLPQRGEEAWVWQEEGTVQAFVRRRRGSKASGVDLLVDPAFRQHAWALLAHALAGASPPVYLTLRSYQGELLEVAHRLGFRPHAEQILLVKFLAVAQEQRQPVSAHKAERHLEAAPSTPSVRNT